MFDLGFKVNPNQLVLSLASALLSALCQRCGLRALAGDGVDQTPLLWTQGTRGEPCRVHQHSTEFIFIFGKTERHRSIQGSGSSCHCV